MGSEMCIRDSHQLVLRMLLREAELAVGASHGVIVWIRARRMQKTHVGYSTAELPSELQCLRPHPLGYFLPFPIEWFSGERQIAQHAFNFCAVALFQERQADVDESQVIQFWARLYCRNERQPKLGNFTERGVAVHYGKEIGLRFARTLQALHHAARRR